MFSGGRQFFNEALSENNPTPLHYSCNNAEPGHLVAAPSPEFNKTIFTRGTSNATALVTRGAIGIAEALKDVFGNEYDNPSYKKFLSLLIKVMLAHGCSWKEIEHRLYTILRGTYTDPDIKKIITRWIGYGLPDICLLYTSPSPRDCS